VKKLPLITSIYCFVNVSLFDICGSGILCLKSTIIDNDNFDERSEEYMFGYYLQWIP